MESAKKALRIFEKYDTLSEIYFDGQGYADAAKLDNVGKYHHDPNMWNYVRTTRIAVPDIQDVITKENRSMDKVQALFADMEERAAAWKELSEPVSYTHLRIAATFLAYSGLNSSSR